MTILGDTKVEDFLALYWQQKPLLIAGASTAYSDVLSADELAGLSCEEQVESRLIIEDSAANWVLQNGPIPEQRFAELPEQNWTLLVQGVDQWLPEVRAILGEFNFLPSWRLDDVMISYATPGGSVGPHFDYYDVFLLQTKGRRRWRLGQQCDQNTPLRQGQPLKLLQDFEGCADFELGPGDMLYIPAGMAHWGTGLDDECMTWSIGFRAPSAKELLGNAVELLADKLPDELRYRDSPQSLKSQRGEINAATETQLRQLCSLISEDTIVEAMSDVLGAMATEPRYPELLDTQPWSSKELQDLFEHSAILQLNGAARIAFRVMPDNRSISRVYVNGDTFMAPTELAEAVCAGEMALSLFECRQGQELLVKLLNAGVYLVEN